MAFGQHNMANMQGRQARWDDVRILLAAFRQGTLGGAAVQLSVDVSTVSRRLMLLEESIGARLFDRSRDGLVITRAGELLLPAAEAMEAAHARLTRDVSSIEQSVQGIVRLAVAPALADQFVAPLVGKLRTKHPAIQLQIDASTRPVNLQQYEADLALRSAEPKGAELLVRALGSARWVPAAAPSVAKRLGMLKAWSDAVWIVWDASMEHFGPAQWLRRYVGDATVALSTNHFMSQLAAARAGAGVVLAPGPHLQAAGLVPVATHRQLQADVARLPVDRLCLLCHRALRDVPRVAAVWDFLVEEAAAMFV